MGDLLDRGAAFLDAQRHQHLSRPVVYRRGTDEKEVQTTIGKTEFEQADDARLIHRVESRDFLVRAADLDLGDGPILPRAADGCAGSAADGPATSSKRGTDTSRKRPRGSTRSASSPPPCAGVTSRSGT